MEVHDRMVMRLHHKNLQLSHEKAEAELRLRQVTALLAELQNVWMDLPPKVSSAIAKVLAGQAQTSGNDGLDDAMSASSTPSRQGSQPDRTPSTGSLRGEKVQKRKSGNWEWFPISIDFGCTKPRSAGLDLDDPVPRPAPLREQMRNQHLAQRRRESPEDSPAIKGEAFLRNFDLQSPKDQKSPFDTPASDTPTYSAGPRVSMPIVTDLSKDGDVVEEESAALVHLEPLPSTAGAGQGMTSSPADMSEVLFHSPSAATLVAEIEMLGRALQRDVERADEELQQRVEAVRKDMDTHKQRLAETIRLANAAQHTELELCKSQLNELRSLVNRNNDEEQATIIQAEAQWAICKRSNELRAHAGQAHVKWLEECLMQRLNAAEDLLASKEREFQHDLTALWDRKALLCVRLREELLGVGSMGLAPANELVHLQKELSDLEGRALVPLQELSSLSCKHEKQHVNKLQMAVQDSRAQCKAAVAHLSSMSEQGRAEQKSRMASLTAEMFSQDKMKRRCLLNALFSRWVLFRRESRLESMEQELLTKFEETVELDAQLTETDVARETAEAALRRAQAARDAGALTSHTRFVQRALVGYAFGRWASCMLFSHNERLREELATNYKESTRLQNTLTDAESLAKCAEAQLERDSQVGEAATHFAITRIARDRKSVV